VRPAIYTTGVTVTAGSQQLLGPVDVTVGTGDWVNVIGPNGAGKSKLLRAIAGLAAAAGRIELAGQPLGGLDRRERARLVAYVAQQPVLPPGLTVEQYVLLGRSPHLGLLSSEGEADLAAVDAALARLGLAKLAGRRLGTLSGGERQRASLARALAQEPAILLLDEPTSALDVGHQQEVLELIDDQRNDLDLTVLSTMHDLTLAAQYGDYIVLLAGGKVVASGPPVQVLTGPHLAAHYGASVDVIHHGGHLVVVPLRQPSQRPEADRTPTKEQTDASA
jgi:iron complex transport system ATP-binding protein